MAKVAYVRVSTIEQNTDRQEVALKEIGMDKYFIDKASGKDTNRPEYQRMLEYVREGDTLYVESISRLARSTRDLLSIVEQLKAKKVELVSLKESIDTGTPQGKFMLTVFGALAELERENILQRQAEGIAIAKARGKYLGRPRVTKPKEFDKVYTDWKAGYITAKRAMQILDMRKSKFYEIVMEHEGRSNAQ